MRSTPRRRILLALAFIASLMPCVPAAAGALEDGIAASKRGDYATARSKFEPLAVQGNAVAQYYLGDLIIRHAAGPHKADGVVWLDQAARGGVAGAMNDLGVILSEGKLVAANQQRANELFMQAASLGYIYAYNNLGMRSAQGIGRPPDLVDAAEWFRLAADQGFAEAQHNLGVLYAGGQGVKLDLVEAYKWMTLAMKQGYSQAAEQRPIIAKQMTPAQLQEAEKRAAQWKPVKQGKPAS